MSIIANGLKGLALGKGKKRARVIDFLRVKYSDATWKWNGEMRVWEASDGRYVRCVCELSPQYDGDDETSIKRYYCYSEGKIPELVF